MALKNSVINLANCFVKISDLFNMIKVDKTAKLFDQLALVLEGTGENIHNTGELVKLYCGSSHMKFHLLEQESLTELFNLR